MKKSLIIALAAVIIIVAVIAGFTLKKDDTQIGADVTGNSSVSMGGASVTPNIGSYSSELPVN